MKLLDSYKAQIDALCANGQRITKAWFTTFNLNLDFFERYVLPLLANGGTYPPRNAFDFENLQVALLGGETGTGIDIHCFCDQQMFDASQPKRMSFPVHLVTPAALGRNKALFHPKVVYLENSAGAAVLGTGSANLSIDGWARNHEVFAFESVTTVRQRDAITAFFSSIAAACQLDAAAFLSEADPVSGKPANWEFFHSFIPDTAFLPYFLQDVGEDLWVFSPYFSTDLGHLLGLIRQEGIKRVHVIPDLKTDGTIRTTYSEALQQHLRDQSLRFYTLPDALRREGFQDGETLRHAKLWLTRSKLAVGSWNMTQPGTGMAGSAENNIEAGFIYALPSPVNLTAHGFDVDASRFMQEAALRNEAPVTTDKPVFPYQVQVIFDWNQYCYEVSVLSPSGDDIPPADTFSLFLPDVKEPQKLITGNPIPLRGAARELCRQRMFVIKDAHGTVCHTGLVLEKSLEHRRGQGFANIYDLLAAVLSGDPVNHGSGRVAVADIMRGKHQDDGDDADVSVFMEMGAHARLGYFSLFQLFASYHEQVNRLVVQQCNESIWKRFLWSQPGSVMELAEKLKTLFEDETGYTTVFRWFTGQEMDALLDRLQACCPEWDAARVEANLRLPLPVLADHDPQQAARRHYLEYITDEIRKGTLTGGQQP